METRVTDSGSDKQATLPVRRRLPVLRASSFTNRFQGGATAVSNHAITPTASSAAAVSGDQEMRVMVEFEKQIRETVIGYVADPDSDGRCALEGSPKDATSHIDKSAAVSSVSSGVDSGTRRTSLFASKIQRGASLKKSLVGGANAEVTPLRRPVAVPTLKSNENALTATFVRKAVTTEAARQPCEAVARVPSAFAPVEATETSRMLKTPPQRSLSDVQRRVNAIQSVVKPSQPFLHSRLLPPTQSRLPANPKSSALAPPRSAVGSESTRSSAADAGASRREQRVNGSTTSGVVLGPLSSQYLPSGALPNHSSDIKRADSSCSSSKSNLGFVAAPDQQSVQSRKLSIQSCDDGSPRMKRAELRSVSRTRRQSSVVESSRLRQLSKTSSSQPSSVVTPRGHQTSADNETRLPAENPSMSKHRPAYFSHQPDLVTNSIHSEEMTSKLHRSEFQQVILEKRLVELRRRLHQRTLGFEAMLVLVKYLSEQFSPVSVGQLETKLNTAGNSLYSANAKCDVLVQQRNALISEIQSIKEEHEVQINALNLTHEMAIRSLDEHHEIELEKRKAEENEKHKMDLKTLTTEHARLVNDLTVTHNKAIASKEQEINSRLIDLEFSNKRKLSEIQRKHDAQVKAMTVQFEQTKSYLTAKVEQLKMECESLQRYQMPTPAAGASILADDKCSNSAEAEIESLRIVLDLRNAEISKLKLANVEIEKQAKELTAAQETIQRLQQKLENAEAIVSMKVDYEKELAEKHVMLMRMYDQETKDNKRLSLNNEQLMWRLTQDGVPQPPLTPNFLRRTVSSASARRRGLSSSEHRPLSQTDFDGFTAEDFVTSSDSKSAGDSTTND